MDNMFTIDDFQGPKGGKGGKGTKGDSGKKIDLAKEFGLEDGWEERATERQGWFDDEYKDAWDDLLGLYKYGADYGDDDYGDLTWHRGALAGLTPEEREKAIAEHMSTAEDGTPYLVKQLDEEALKGAPVTNFTELLNIYEDYDLADFATDLDMEDADALDKQALVERLSDLQGNEDALRDMLLRCTDAQFSTLQALVERDTPIRFDASDAQKYKDLAAVHPYTTIFKQGPVYTFSITDEVREFCKGLGLEGGMETRQLLTTMGNVADVLTTFLGVVRLDEAYAVYAAHEENPYSQDVFTMMVGRCATEEGNGFDLCLLDDEICLVADTLSDQAAVDNGALRALSKGIMTPGDSELADAYDELVDKGAEAALAEMDEFRRTLLRAQKEIGPRPVDDVLGKDPRDFMLALPSARALLAHFDAHVPDTHDDYAFADLMMEIVLAMHQDATCPEDIIDMFNEEGAIEFVEDEEEFERLVRNFFNEAPSWENAGWSPKEFSARKVLPFRKSSKQKGKGKSKR